MNPANPANVWSEGWRECVMQEIMADPGAYQRKCVWVSLVRVSGEDDCRIFCQNSMDYLLKNLETMEALHGHDPEWPRVLALCLAVKLAE